MNHTSKTLLIIGLVLTTACTAKRVEEDAIDNLLIPSEEAIFSHVATIVDQGIRRPGYPADVWVETYIEEQFRKYGLQNVRKEKVTHHGKDYGEEPEINMKWLPIRTSLTVYTESKSLQIPAFSVPYAESTDEHGINAEVIFLKSETVDKDAKGKIVLYPVEFREGVSHQFYKRRAEWYYDPDNTFVLKKQAPAFNVEGNAVMEYALESGAVGFIGVITGNPDPDVYEYYMPADGGVRPIPGVYISEENGDKIKALMEKGPVRATLVSEVSLESFVSHNITGTLPGKSDDWIIIGTHHDAPFYGAVEDASGIALVLAQAEYWSHIPEEERPHNVLFLVDSGHICGVTGCWTFVKEHEDMLEDVVLEIHLEHIALEYTNEDGKFVPTGYRQPLWWYTSESSRLINLVKGAIISEDIKRSYIFLPEAMNRKTGLPTSDGAFFHRYNVLLVNLVSGPAYLFTPADTLDKVDRASLAPVTRAVIRIIEGLDGTTAEQIRSEIRR
ncbi:MAG: hypothetical protein AYK19_01765 [Theionarchaea archaeon DG-70-1]|nr:MAG: hypothetical protein AYK19_01765 [Theionarchaea archaeon DG-70-1]